MAALIPISSRTRIVGIIGDPIAHSLSPAMHNAAFRALRLDYVYVAFRVPPEELREAVAGLRALGVAGVNVTVPHKERVMRYLDAITPTGRRAGAVNTLLLRHGQLHGDNTDVVGFLRALNEARCRVRGARVLVIGAGGVARAVLVGLAQARARAVTIVNRTPRRAAQLATRFRNPSMDVTTARLDALCDARVLGVVDIVVNATALGLHATDHFMPVAYGLTPPHCLFYDLIYAGHSDFLRSAARAGRLTLDGRSMLLHQGAAAFTLWTGRPAPVTVMRAALSNAGRRRKPRAG